MGFINNAIDSVSNATFDDKTEKKLLLKLLQALDDDLVVGGYDPTENFIEATQAFNKHLESKLDEAETEVVDDDVDLDEDFPEAFAEEEFDKD